jgi:hypothetical protein
MVLKCIIFNMPWLYYYYYANIHTMVLFFFGGEQSNLMSLMNTWGFFPSSKGATTSLKPIYKCY